MRLTESEIEYGVGRTVIYSILFVIYSSHRLWNNWNLEYALILFTATLTIIAAYRMGHLLRQALHSNGLVSVTFLDRNLTGIGLMIISGGLAMYIFLYKGFYRLYLLLESFEWVTLALRLIAIFLGFKLIQSLDKLQKGFNIIKKKHTVE